MSKCTSFPFDFIQFFVVFVEKMNFINSFLKVTHYTYFNSLNNQFQLFKYYLIENLKKIKLKSLLSRFKINQMRKRVFNSFTDEN